MNSKNAKSPLPPPDKSAFKSKPAAFGLGPNGSLIVVGASPDLIEVSPLQLIGGKKSIKGWWSGIPTDSEDTVRFSSLTGVHPMIEKIPLEKVNEGYDRMMSGKAEFRVVITFA